MKLPRPLLLAGLAVLAYFKIGNAKRRLGAYRRKKRLRVALTSNGVPHELSVRASVAEQKT